MQEFLKKSTIVSEFLEEHSCNQGQLDSYLEYRSAPKKGYVAGFEPVSPYTGIGFDHHDISFIGKKTIHKRESLDDNMALFVNGERLDVTDASMETEYVMTFGENALSAFRALIEAKEGMEEAQKVTAKRTASDIREEKLRDRTPALKKAWTHYQTLRKLCK